MIWDAMTLIMTPLLYKLVRLDVDSNDDSPLNIILAEKTAKKTKKNDIVYTTTWHRQIGLWSHTRYHP